MTTSSVRAIRKIRIPDPVRVTNALRSPDQGPRILFFSGGTALRDTSQRLVDYTHNSVHLVTPFDSGGSSAVLRRYFDMPAIGDLRSRLMVLADRTLNGVTEVYDLFTYRLPKTASPEELRAELGAMVRGSHPLVARISDPMRKTVLHHLDIFEDSIDLDFNLRGASIGNLILTAGYLEHSRHIDPIVSIYSQLVKVRGEVRLLTNSNLQLRAVLANGAHLIGQHLITGKETPSLDSTVTELCLVDPAKGNVPFRPPIGNKIRDAIRNADLICYPVGSFYSSLIANLLPAGVGQAISQSPCPKVFIPNTFADPESLGLSLADQTRILLRHLRADAPGTIATRDVLDVVLLDPTISYPGAENPEQELAALGVPVMLTPLAVKRTGAIDPRLLCEALLSLI
jgi:CofD-related protein of GAK system